MGRAPNPPYVVFRYQEQRMDPNPIGGVARRIQDAELDLLLAGPRSEESGEVHRLAETIRALYDGYRQPEYKTILREVLPKNVVASIPVGLRHPAPLFPAGQ